MNLKNQTILMRNKLTSDGVVNVLDVVGLVNLILDGSYTEVADVNSDGQLNVLDVVTLVNIILGS